MGYPDDKETWERVETNDIIVKGHTNNWEDFLERLQDVLGLGIKLGYASVKFLLDYLKEKADLVDSKFDKTGGEISGEIQFTQDTMTIKPKAYRNILIHDTGSGKRLTIGEVGYEYKIGTSLKIVHTGEGMQMYYGLYMNDADIEFMSNSIGVIMKSPNNSRHRISIENDGTVISTPL